MQTAKHCHLLKLKKGFTLSHTQHICSTWLRKCLLKYKENLYNCRYNYWKKLKTSLIAKCFQKSSAADASKSSIGGKGLIRQRVTFMHVEVCYLTVTVTFGLSENVSCTDLANNNGVRWLDGISIKCRAIFCPSAFALPSFHESISLKETEVFLYIEILKN